MKRLQDCATSSRRVRTPAWLAALAGLLLFLPCLPARATLVAIVPSRDGLVIAVDSRLTFLGAQCDGAFKILTPARPVRTVAVVTGDSVFVAPPPAVTNDLCVYLAAAPRLLDVGAVVKQALERGTATTAELSAACVEAVERFRAAYPDALRTYAGKEIFSVVVVSYDPGRSESFVRRFAVRMDADGGRLEAGDMSETKIDAQSASDVWVYGEADWVKRTVFAGAGRRFLSEATLELLKAHKPVAEVSKERAVDAAGNVIGAARRTAETDPPPSGIGGVVQVVVIGKEPKPETVSPRWRN